MNYIIYDLEYNQINTENSRLSKTMKINRPWNFIFEIIQIGAIKLDENLKYVSNFKMYVKPKFLPKIDKHVLELMQVDENYIKLNGLPFNKVFKEFIHFIGEEKTTLITWSNNDLPILRSNISAWKISYSLKKHINIDLQKVVMNKHNLSKQISLKKVLDMYNISNNNCKLHDAYTDASLTKEIFKKIGIEEINEFNYDVNFRIKKKIKLKNNSLFLNEISKVPHCNICGRFIKTQGKTQFYLIRGNIQMNKICYCESCRVYLFKKYLFDTKLCKLKIQDAPVHKNNIVGLKNKMKEITRLKEIEKSQLLK
ncbi:TPA: exonuclease domain-containing protein [Clostridium botulinum]|nr:exonuclease domain-containing protein [Clostridium botulinum]HBJ1652697.1 exonuclease domain-containing protein [Clostridium botulinum]